MAPQGRAPPDYEELSTVLQALAYPARLEILEAIRSPTTLRDIEVTPRRGPSRGSPEAQAARTTVRAHLLKLVDAGLVETDVVEQRGREVPRYRSNQPQLYGLLEDMASLPPLQPDNGDTDGETDTADALQREPPPEGPHCVLVHGVGRGRTFPLDEGSQGEDGGWSLGRDPDASIPLSYDPFVSQEHARITERGDELVVHDLGSKNGTRVNWHPLDTGGTHRLAAADIIEVGRSLLVFRPG